MFDISLFINLNIFLVELRNIQEHTCRFKIDKITYSIFNLEQRLTSAKISL